MAQAQNYNHQLTHNSEFNTTSEVDGTNISAVQFEADGKWLVKFSDSDGIEFFKTWLHAVDRDESIENAFIELESLPLAEWVE